MYENLTNKFVPDYYKLHKTRTELLFDQFSYWNICTIELKSTLGSLYARYVLSALERNCDPRAQMNNRQRYGWCRAVFNQAIYNELIPNARAKDSMTLRVALVAFRWKKALVCMSLGRAIYIIRKKLPMFYNKVKSGR
jgi:hypothetical protein